jgi:hypothetical protein
MKNTFFKFDDGTALRVVSTGHDEWGDIEATIACSDPDASVTVCLQRGNDAHSAFGGLFDGATLAERNGGTDDVALEAFYAAIVVEDDDLKSRIENALRDWLRAAPGVNFLPHPENY